jgi:hypothetical protein
MATWTSILQSNIEPEKPIRASDIWAIYQNILALAEGANGAPKLNDNALPPVTAGDFHCTKEYSNSTKNTGYITLARFRTCRKGTLRFLVAIEGRNATGRWLKDGNTVGYEFNTTSSIINAQDFSIASGNVFEFQMKTSHDLLVASFYGLYMGIGNLSDTCFPIIFEM